ncbi:hypothetical protein [Nocardia brasiliensis]|uniref:hypothetical protein n=1 Tax=Nocardia brasiliensis TaxID=37326 RepID=UPI003D8F635A
MRTSTSILAVIVFSGAAIGVVGIFGSARAEPEFAHCRVNRMEPPRSMGTSIVFDASVTCDRKPQNSYFNLSLIKVDRTPEQTEHVVEEYEYHNPSYFEEDGFSFTEYHDCTRNPESRVDGYYTTLHVVQYHEGGVADLIVDTKPPINLLC